MARKIECSTSSNRWPRLWWFSTIAWENRSKMLEVKKKFVAVKYGIAVTRTRQDCFYSEWINELQSWMRGMFGSLIWNSKWQLPFVIINNHPAAFILKKTPMEVRLAKHWAKVDWKQNMKPVYVMITPGWISTLANSSNSHWVKPSKTKKTIATPYAIMIIIKQHSR